MVSLHTAAIVAQHLALLAEVLWVLLALVRHVQAVRLLQGSLQRDGVQGETKDQGCRESRVTETVRDRKRQAETQRDKEGETETHGDERDQVCGERPRQRDRDRHRE